MNPRHRRLAADLTQMNALADGSRTVGFRAEGDPPDVYHVMVTTPGLIRDAAGAPALRKVHRFTLYLHLDYPRRPPIVAWETPIAHPNILPPDRNGGVCIGAWSAGEGLADLVTRIADLAAYRSFNVDDALDHEAAEWVRALGLEPGCDVEALVAAAASPPHTAPG